MKKRYVTPASEEVRLNVADLMTDEGAWNGTSKPKGADESDAKNALWNEQDDSWQAHDMNVWDR